MLAHSSLKTRICIAASVMAIALMSSPLCADIVTGSFSGPSMNTSGPVSILTIPFNVADPDDVTFEANFDIIDVGIQINVNGNQLFSTGINISQFNAAGVFLSDPATDINDGQFVNLGFPFNPLANGQPRLTVVSDSSGTSLSGNNQLASSDDGAPLGPITPVDFTTSFNIANFSDLLIPNGANTIEIVSLNDPDSRALLQGDFTVEALPAAVPEPSSLSLLLLGSMFWAKRRRQK